MSDLGSEELEEEGENDLGVRAPGQGGTSGVRRSSGAGGVGTRAPRGRGQDHAGHTTGGASRKSL